MARFCSIVEKRKRANFSSFFETTKKYGGVFLFLLCFLSRATYAQAQEGNDLFLPEGYLSDRSSPKDHPEKVLAFMLRPGKACRIDSKTNLLCSLASPKKETGIFVYAGVLDPGEVIQTGSAGLVFRW